jgi:CRP/FNR family cyclic AMP-dependent transcriptional regulator
MVKATGPLDVLAQRGWLAQTPPTFRRIVLARTQVREFRKGAAVYRLHDRPGGLWAVVKGAVELEIPSPGTATHLVHVAVSGFWFGEGPLVAGTPRLMTVIASRPSTLATLPLADCHAILRADPAAWRWIALMTAMTLELSSGIIADLLLRDPVQRVAALLLRLSGMRSAVFVAKEPAPIYLSQEKLAQLVNLSRNSIIPILGEFQKRGLIAAKYGSTVVSDVKGLAAAIQTGTQAVADA